MQKLESTLEPAGFSHAEFQAISSILGTQAEDILEQLDEKAKLTIHPMVLDEYSRCTKSSANSVVGLSKIGENTSTSRNVKGVAQ